MDSEEGCVWIPNHEKVGERGAKPAQRCLETLHGSRDHDSFLTVFSGPHRADTEQRFNK